MRHRIYFLYLLLCSMLPLQSSDLPLRPVSEAEALAVAQREFDGQDVDYLIRRDNSNTEWTIFVDAEPMKGWTHDCYILTIPKTSALVLKYLYPTKIEKRNMPPDTGDYDILSVKERIADGGIRIAKVAKRQLTPAENAIASNTYAVIISGGINKHSNYYRYWNDCSFIYNTLINKYGISKANLFLLIADGDNPEDDMLHNGNPSYYTSQPLDLDGDGKDETILAATKENVTRTLNELSTRLHEGDHLFIYVIDHGSSYRDSVTFQKHSTICLWRGSQEYNANDKLKYELADFEFANLIYPFCANKVVVSVVLGQCFSGGFIDDLEKTGCVVATACTATRGSNSHPYLPYDEFVYNWTAAMNEAKHYGDPINSDSDGDGIVTMKEAFDKALELRKQDEEPQYQSTPQALGDELAFNYMPAAIDLYIKDTEEDTGKEPNLVSENFWSSPSICVRNNPDGNFTHQNPEYSTSHTDAYVYVRVHNRGRETYDGNDKYVALYWAYASTGITTKVWKGREMRDDGKPTGGYAGSVKIPEIPSGEYRDVMIEWALPEMVTALGESQSHFCLAARIMDTATDNDNDASNWWFDMKGSNDLAQKNVTIVKNRDMLKKHGVIIRNIVPADATYSIELQPRTTADEALFEASDIYLEMADKIYRAWERGGSGAENVDLPGTARPQSVKLHSARSRLINVAMKADEFDEVKLTFDFVQTTERSDTKYTVDLVQTDADGKIIGGETFEILHPIKFVTPIDPIIDIEPIPRTENSVRLTATNPQLKSYTWINDNKEVISESKSVEVMYNAANKSVTVIAETGDGETSTGSVDLTSLYGIENVTVTKSDIIIELKNSTMANSTVELVSILSGEAERTSEVTGKSISFDRAGLTSSLYLVNYMVDGEILDRVKIKIE